MTERLSGRVGTLFCQLPAFSAGLLELPQGESLRFSAKTALVPGDCVQLEGEWLEHPKYGYQFVARSVKFEIPDDADGLLMYLTGPRFAGLEYHHAVRLARFGSKADLERMLFLEPSPLLRILCWEPAALGTLRRNWRAGVRGMKVRTLCAAYELTPNQVFTLESRFGDRWSEILDNDPYGLVGVLPGLSFRTVDEKARSEGLPFDHPPRLRAGTLFALQQETQAGHTWINKSWLAALADSLLGLDRLAPVEAVIHDLAHEGCVINTEDCVALPDLYWAESDLRDIFETHGKERVPFPVASLPCEDFQDQQRTAYEQALKHRLSVITGSAGTGKTFLIAHLVRTFQKGHRQVALCARPARPPSGWKKWSARRGSPAPPIRSIVSWNTMEPRIIGTICPNRWSIR